MGGGGRGVKVRSVNRRTYVRHGKLA
jgi:hypothetical protein